MRKPSKHHLDHRKSGIRCAIYTRKSSEEGLEQDFNSLDAQREACEAYILSQKHEGWVVLAQMYDDGGISGATMERPALLRLLADIEAGKIDTVVVYKVDRLTRSLGDFAKIVDVFDCHQVSFVSITQAFNTTTSMGRLTLNMLLSFAQFEREVTGERIRDKIAASKQKGMWMQALRARPRRRRLPPDLGERQVAAIASNVLARGFEAPAPNRKWIADFTYVWTAEGWLYVAAVIDLFSRRVVGWSMKAEMTAQLVTDALMMAIWRRGKPDALLHHSDRGSQYSSEQFQRLMADHGVICSMSRSGNVWDNAAMESFFSSLKTERTARKTYRSRDEAKADVRRRAMLSLLPPRLSLPDWIESEVRLPAGVSATPGKVRLWKPQRGIAEAIGDPAIERVSVLKGVRVGYSTLLTSAVASFVANEPSPILLFRTRTARTASPCRRCS